MKDAFAKTMKDPNFLEEAKKLNLEINPLYADEMQKLINDVIATKPEVVTLAKAAITEGEVFDCKKLVKDAKSLRREKIAVGEKHVRADQPRGDHQPPIRCSPNSTRPCSACKPSATSFRR